MILESYLSLLGSMFGDTHQAQQEAWIAQQNALANYCRHETPEDYNLKQEAWRKTVSQNWLNALLDIEIGF